MGANQVLGYGELKSLLQTLQYQRTHYSAALFVV